MAYLRNFGHSSPTSFADLGINGKNSEFHAAMGLCNLAYIDDIIKSRKKQAEIYDKWLKSPAVTKPAITEGTEYNYSYYTLVFEAEEVLEKVIIALEAHWIYPRRYFYPSLEQLPYITGSYSCPVSNDVSRRVLCLPVYFGLSEEEQEMIVRIILRTINFG
jgi:dTDP-4-amino-4,6-dideoxygalactose transaminase